MSSWRDSIEEVDESGIIEVPPLTDEEGNDIIEVPSLSDEEGSVDSGSLDASAPEIVKVPSWRDSIVEVPLEKVTQEPLPDYASGNSPESPIRQSPVSVLQNLWLGLGNDPGRLRYLKENFEDARQVIDTDGELVDNEFVVKHEGLWKTVDAPGFGEGSSADKAWEATKDIVRKLPLTAQIVASSTAAATATPLMGALVAAGSQALKTSLGRAVGTYDPGTALDQVSELAQEGLLAAGGVKIAQGMKPTAETIAEQLPAWSKAVKKLSDPVKQSLRNVWARFSTLGPDSFDEVLESPTLVSSAMKSAAKAAGVDDEKYYKFLAARSVNEVKEVSKSAQPILSTAWENITNQILKAAPQQFAGSTDEAFRAIQADAVNEGLGVIRPVTEKAAKLLSGTADDTIALVSSTVRRPLSKEAAMTLLKAHNGIVPEGFEFSLRSADDLVNLNKVQGGSNPLLADRDMIEMVREFYGKQIDSLSGMAKFTGKRAAEQVMDFKKNLNSGLAVLKSKASEKEFYAVLNKAKQIDAVANQYVDNIMDKNGIKPLWTELNSMYTHGKEEAAPFLSAAIRGHQKPEVFQPLLDKMLSKGGKHIAVKEGVHALRDLAEKHAPEMLPALDASLKKIRINEAARAARPWLKPGGHSGMLGDMLKGVTAIGTSPRLQFHYLRAFQALTGSSVDDINKPEIVGPLLKQLQEINPATVTAVWNTVDALKGPMNSAFNDAKTFLTMQDMMFRTPQMEQNIRDRLLQGGPQEADKLQEALQKRGQ